MYTKLLRFISIMGILISTFGISAYSANDQALPRKTRFSNTNALAGKKVTLDPGHGWSGDTGATGNGMYEKDVALDVARRVKSILEGQGVIVTMTRNGDEPNYGLIESENRANRYAADIVVAIHTNAGAGATGTESCYVVDTSTSANSLKLATALTNSVSSQLGLTKRKDWPENSSSACVRGRWSPPYLYIHWMKPVAALIETAFINGAAKDVDILKNKRQELAQAIASGIANYFGETPPPASSCTIPSGQFCGEYYNNQNLSGSPTFTQNTSSIGFDWGSNGPGNGVGVDHFSARWQGSFSFENASYNFSLTADDGIRLYVDNVLKSPTSPTQDPWRDQGVTTYTYVIPMSAGNHSIKVEYYENGGGAVAKASWQKTPTKTYSSAWVSQSAYPTITRGSYADLWVTFKNTGNTTWYNTYSPNRTHLGTLDPSTGKIDYPSPFVCTPGWVGNNRPAILAESSVPPGSTGTFRFRACVPSNMTPGTYRLAVAPLVESVSWMIPPSFVYWDITVKAAGNSNMALNRPTWSTSQENSNYPAYRGNDGNTGTRWSSQWSAASTGLNEWWIVDLGSIQTFSTVVIRWETAFAANHFIGSSNDGQTFNGYSYSLSAAGNYQYNLGSRNARYVGIWMSKHAACCGNFSFWEVEVYQNPLASALQELDIAKVLKPKGKIRIIRPSSLIIPANLPQILLESTITESDTPIPETATPTLDNLPTPQP